MSKQSTDLFESIFKANSESNTLAVCVKCGSTATYRGTPKEVNDAAEQFYKIHERCWRGIGNQATINNKRP